MPVHHEDVNTANNNMLCIEHWGFFNQQEPCMAIFVQLM